MAKKNLYFIDTETTGLSKFDRLLQVAYRLNGKEVNEYFCPPVEIGVEAMAVHHITNQFVREKPAFLGSKCHADLKKAFADPKNIFVAHNAPFDIGMLEREDIKVESWICTKKVAQYLYEKEGTIKGFALQKLRYTLNLDVADDAKAHDASGDIAVLEALFNHLYAECEKRANEKATEKGRKAYTRDEILDRMMKISQAPINLTMRFPFGKYVGQFVKDVAASDPRYCDWLMKSKEEKDDKDDLYKTIAYFRKHGSGPES